MADRQPGFALFLVVVLTIGTPLVGAARPHATRPDLIFADDFETGDASGWTLAFASCGDNLANGPEECDGTDLAGLTCAALGFSGGGLPECTICCTAAAITCAGNHTITYERIPQSLYSGDLTRVRWHRSGRFALVLTNSGTVLRYDADSSGVSVATNLGANVITADLDASWNGERFVIVGSALGIGKLWPVEVSPGDVLSFLPPVTVGSGTPVAVAAQPRSGREWALAIRTGVSSTNVLGLWNISGGLHAEVGYTAGAGVWDLMWRQTSRFGAADEIVISHGVNGADSRTFEVNTGTVVGNGWPPSYGNPGGTGWRGCAGSYGMATGWSSNQVYVYDGVWVSTTLPGVATAASPQSVGWRSDGTRAMVVGRAIGSPLRATVVEHRPGMAVTYDDSLWVDASIPDFDQPPWLGSNTQYLHDVDWQPNSACDGGLIVGDLDGSTGKGLLIRFYDEDDADCGP